MTIEDKLRELRQLYIIERNELLDNINSDYGYNYDITSITIEFYEAFIEDIDEILQ